jgi:hypothetical protein
MTNFRQSPVLFLIVLILASGVRFAGSEAVSVGYGAVQNQVGSFNDFPSVFPNPGCFGVSTRILGVEGAFAVVAVDSIGGVYVAYQSSQRENGSTPYLHVYFSYSHDYGESWSESFRVDDNESSSVQCDSPSIAVDQLTGHVFVAWKDNRTGVGKAYIDKSVDRGVSFGLDHRVCDWPYDHVDMGLPRTLNIEADNTGKIFVAWIAYYGSSYTDCNILLARSGDGGQTFSAPTVVNPDEGEARLLHPWIAVDGENALYVVYSTRNSTFSAVYLAKSLDTGSSFAMPAKVNDDSTNRYRGGTQVNVSPNGKIHVTWTDGRAGDGSQYLDIYSATSSDGGFSFEPNNRVNDDSFVSPAGQVFTRGAQGTPSIVTDSNSRVHIVWEDFRNFLSETTYCRDIYYASSEAGLGFTMNLKANSVNPDAGSVNCADPNMAIDSQDNFYIVYSDAPSGDNEHHEIYFVFAPSSTWKWTTFLDWVHYHNYTEIATILSALNDTYSYIMDVFSIGKSWRGKDVYCVRLTNESDAKPKSEVLFVGYHHAQEQISAELPLYYVVFAATNYGLDENITNFLNTREIYVIVALNVDGLDLFGTNDRHRKNAYAIDEDNDSLFDEDPPEDLNGNGLIEVLMNYTDPNDPKLVKYEGIDNDGDGINAEDWIGGVDLNRNYPVGWQDGVSDPASPVYRGPSPFSEPETQAMMNFVSEHNFTHAISFHSGLEFIVYPWGCTADPTSDDAKFVEIAEGLSALTGNTPYASPTVNFGIWDDWIYSEARTLALTCEIFRNETWMDANLGAGPYPNTVWEGGERWLYNPFPGNIETVIQRWLPVFAYVLDLARPPDVAVSTITASKSIVGQDYAVNVTVVVANQGSMIEQTNTTVYLNADALRSLSFAVGAGESFVCTFIWNTTGFSKGNYTISALVGTIPGETDTADNTIVGSEIKVTIQGDINGDFKVSLTDLVMLANAYGTKLGDTKWNPNADINGNGVVDLPDLVLMANHYGQHYP